MLCPVLTWPVPSRSGSSVQWICRRTRTPRSSRLFSASLSTSALENQEISGLDNYNIKKNGRYRDAFSSDIAGEEQESESESEESDDFGFDDEEDDDDGK
eukprot:2499881-Rhodomonas_salina.1